MSVNVCDAQLAIISTLIRFSRPHLKKDGRRTAYRKCWEWFHRLYGFFVIDLGFVQVTLGVFLIVPPLGVWVAWVILLAMWCIAFITIGVVRCVLCCCRRSDDDDEDEKHEMK